MEQENIITEQRKKVQELLGVLDFKPSCFPLIKDFALEYIHGRLKELQRLKELGCTTDAVGNIFTLSHLSNVTKIDVDTPDQHIMFKLILNKEDDEYNEMQETKTIAWVKDKEGNKLYGYEFLIEFDVHNFSYGIYYGCKTIIPSKDRKPEEVANQIKSIKEEWDKSRIAELTKVLTNIFTGISFEKKLIPTTDAINNTFWPFWIRLNDNEDIFEIAAMATLFIARFCLAIIKTDCKLDDLPKTTDLNLDAFITDKKKKPIYHFTERCWNEIKKNNNRLKFLPNVAQLETVSEALSLQAAVLTRQIEYEYAWQFKPKYTLKKGETGTDGKTNTRTIDLDKQLCIHLIKNLWNSDILQSKTSGTKTEKNIYLLNQIWLMSDGKICDDPQNQGRDSKLKNETITNLKDIVADLENTIAD